MPSLTSLPSELISNISGNLSPADVLALRHTSKQLAVTAAQSFLQTFERITVTCSKAGLHRLERLTDFTGFDADTKTEACYNIVRVVIHTLSATRLIELAKDFDEDGDGSPYLYAYVYIRKTLLSGLKAFPKLKIVTVTNEDFNGVTEPTLDLGTIPNMDPFFEALRGVYTSEDQQGDLDPSAPRHYGFESVLSILPVLTQNDVQLDLNVDFANAQENSGIAYLDTPMCRNNGTEHLEEQMYGCPYFISSGVIRAFLHKTTMLNSLKHDNRAGMLIALINAETSPVKNITLEKMHLCALSHVLHFPHLTTLKIRHSESHIFLNRFFDRHSDTLRCVELSDCYGNCVKWEFILRSLTRMRALQKLTITDCKALLNTHHELVFDVEYDRETSDEFEWRGTGSAGTELIASRFATVLKLARTRRKLAAMNVFTGL